MLIRVDVVSWVVSTPKVMSAMPPFTSKGVPLAAAHVRVNALFAVQTPVTSRVSVVAEVGVTVPNAAAPPPPVATHVTVPEPVLQIAVLALIVIVSATSAAPFGDTASPSAGVNANTS